MGERPGCKTNSFPVLFLWHLRFTRKLFLAMSMRSADEIARSSRKES